MAKTKQIWVESITDTLENNYMPYAMSVIVSRAIPEIDGFKPSHRKLLYTMYKMGLLGGQRTKSANVVGQTMKLNPHGDAAIYETMVRLTRGNASLLHPFVDSKGNFGKQHSRDMQYAASRYTEVRLDPICEELFKSIDKNVVDFVPNYDGTMQEPSLLPATFPSVLVNANQGIAVGMASNIASFNLNEVCEATIALINDENAEIDEIIKGPDFPGGADIIEDSATWKEICRTGRGSVKLRSRYRIDESKNIIEIYEIPYSTTVEAVMDAVAELVKAGKIKEISDIRDETDLNGLKITVDLKRSANATSVINRMMGMTPLQSNFACNFNILIGGKPKVLGISDILKEWINFRRSCASREIEYDLGVKNKKIHLLEGLELLLLDIDKAVKIIRNTEKEEEVIPNLCEAFQIDKEQADYIADIRLRNLNREYILKRTSDLSSLKSDVKKLGEILADPKLLDDMIIQTLKSVMKKYGLPRKTGFISSGNLTSQDSEELIEDYNLKVFITRHGYLKKIPLTSLRSCGELRTKEDDEVFIEFDATNRSEILVYTDKCNVYKMFLYDIKDCKPSEFGEYLPTACDFEDGENIVYALPAEDYSGTMIFAYENGKVSRVPLDSYSTKTKRKKLVSAFSDSAPVVSCDFIPDSQDRDYFIISNLNKALSFSSSQIPVKSTRNNQGVQVMSSKRGSKVVSFERLDKAGINNADYYRTKNIPAIGYYLKDADISSSQLDLSEIVK